MNIITHNQDPFEEALFRVKQVKDTNTAAIQEIAAMVEQMETFGKAIQEIAAMVEQMETFGKLMDCAGIPRMCQGERPLSFWQRLDMYFKVVE